MGTAPGIQGIQIPRPLSTKVRSVAEVSGDRLRQVKPVYALAFQYDYASGRPAMQFESELCYATFVKASGLGGNAIEVHL